MGKEGVIITKVRGPTNWCAGMVVVPKLNQKVHICVYLTHLNKSVQWEHHIRPSVDHILAQLVEAQFFTKLDTSSEFWQVPLSIESVCLTTLILLHHMADSASTVYPSVFLRSSCVTCPLPLKALKESLASWMHGISREEQHDVNTKDYRSTVLLWIKRSVYLPYCLEEGDKNSLWSLKVWNLWCFINES